MSKRAPKSAAKTPTTKARTGAVRRVEAVVTPAPSLLPAPAIIDLLRRVSSWRNETPAERDQVLTSVRMVLGAWDTRGDLEELRALLGVKPRRKRKAS